MSDNLRQLQRRIDALRPFRDATIPVGRCILKRPLPADDKHYDPSVVSASTDDPVQTWAAAWTTVDHIWRQDVIPPLMAGCLERAVATLETLRAWAVEKEPK